MCFVQFISTKMAYSHNNRLSVCFKVRAAIIG